MISELYHDMHYEVERRSAGRVDSKNKNVKELLGTIYFYFLHLGTDSAKSQREARYIQLSNFVAMTSLAASLFYIPLSIAWLNPLWFMAVNALMILSVAVFILNKLEMVNFSRRLYLFALHPILLAGALLTGPAARGENFLLIAILLPFMLFDLRHYRLIIAGIVIPVLLIVLYPYFEPGFVSFQLSQPRQEILATSGVFMGACLIIAAVFQFVYHTRRGEEGLATQTAALSRSNTELEQFAYIISHDLKTPVRNISSFMTLLSNKHATSLDPEALEFVAYARSGAQRMERLIDDVLTYSRIGRYLSPPASVDLDDMMITIKYEMQEAVQATNADIKIYKELPVIHGVHSPLLYQLFHQLIQNALKYNQSSRPEIIISWDQTSEHYLFSVADNGIGIEDRFQEQVFQMFKRLHNENEYAGTGIGLAICKKIVSLYRGDIWFEGQPGQGTTFYFTISK